MNALNDKRVASLLSKLHHDAEAADSDFMADVMRQLETSGQTLDEMAAKMIVKERSDYRAMYRGHANHFLAISPAYGRFLYAVARARRASRIVEFGTSMGISTIYLAVALQDNGGGTLIGSELEPTKVIQARRHLEMAGLSHLTEIREGDALETLKNVGGEVDILLIDGAWSLYLSVLKLIEPQLAPGALILGENAFASDYLEYVRDPANGYLSRSLAIDEGRGNEFTVWVGR